MAVSAVLCSGCMSIKTPEGFPILPRFWTMNSRLFTCVSAFVRTSLLPMAFPRNFGLCYISISLYKNTMHILFWNYITPDNKLFPPLLHLSSQMCFKVLAFCFSDAVLTRKVILWELKYDLMYIWTYCIIGRRLSSTALERQMLDVVLRMLKWNKLWTDPVTHQTQW